MSAARLRELLLTRGRPWAAPIEAFLAVESTNDVLRERARRGAPSWSVILAESQTAGRGRRGHVWTSPAGNLYLSVLLATPRRKEAQTLLQLVAGLAVAESLVEFGVEASLKWPNDVVAGGRKLAGLLAEGSSLGDTTEWIALGVGVNVGVDPARVEPGLEGSATSMATVTGASPGVLDVAAALLVRLHDRYADLESGSERALLDAWRARAVPWWGRPVEVVSGGQVVRGIAVEIDPAGGLILRVPNGGHETILTGEARELRLDESGMP